MTVHRMVESKMKKQCEEKVFGYLGIYAYVLSISNHIHLILCINCFVPSIDFLLFRNALMRLLSTVHCMLEPKKDKKICADHEYLQPLIILIHTRTYSYILVHTRAYYHTPQCTSNQAGFALR